MGRGNLTLTPRGSDNNSPHGFVKVDQNVC